MLRIGKCQLPELLRKRGITQTQLSDMTGISKTQLSDYAHNRVGMSLLTAKLISGGLGCSMEDLYEWVYDNQGHR